jgi:hypothetical protein
MGFTDVVGLIHLTTVLSILIFCTQNMDWSAVTVDAVGDSRLSAISPLILGTIRLICGSIVWGTLLFIALSGTPVFMVVLLRDGNKRLVSLIGPQRYAMYTVWSWTIQVHCLTSTFIDVGSCKVTYYLGRAFSLSPQHIAASRCTSPEVEAR